MTHFFEAYGLMLVKAIFVHLAYVLASVAAATVVALLLGVLEAAVPKGPVRGVVRLAAGLVLAIVVFSPLVGALPGWISGALGSEWEAAAAFSDDLEQTNESYLETIMSQRAAEYIVTQAE